MPLQNTQAGQVPFLTSISVWHLAAGCFTALTIHFTSRLSRSLLMVALRLVFLFQLAGSGSSRFACSLHSSCQARCVPDREKWWEGKRKVKGTDLVSWHLPNLTNHQYNEVPLPGLNSSWMRREVKASTSHVICRIQIDTDTKATKSKAMSRLMRKFSVAQVSKTVLS